MGTVGEGEKEWKREWQRKRREERRAKGLCLYCGKAQEQGGLKGFCAGCGAKHRERMRRREARLKAERAAQGRGMRPPCGVRCPDCAGECFRGGKTPDGRQRYICKRCKRINLGTGERLRFRVGEKGKERYKITLFLSMTADWALQGYCRERRVSTGQAIREIFRKAANEPAVPMSLARGYTTEEGRRVVRFIRPKYAPTSAVTGRVRLPDLRAQSLRERMSRTGYAKYRPTVLVARKVGVALDGLALAGLLKVAQAWRVSHQEAARRLIARAGGWSVHPGGGGNIFPGGRLFFVRARVPHIAGTGPDAAGFRVSRNFCGDESIGTYARSGFRRTLLFYCFVSCEHHLSTYGGDDSDNRVP